MNARMIVVVLFVALVGGVAACVAAQGQEKAEVFIGSDGSLRFDEPQVTYTGTGMFATPEAQKYPEAIQKLLAEERAFVPLETEVVDNKMVGLWTWRVTRKTELVLAVDNNTLIVRNPLSESEKAIEVKEVTNIAGIFVALFFILEVMALIVARKSKPEATFVATFAATVATFAATVATFAATLAFAVAVATVATFAALATTAFAAAAYVVSENRSITARYRQLTIAAMVAMAIAVMAVIL